MFRSRVVLGVTVLWLALSMLFDGLNTLVLPHQLLGLTDPSSRATALGLITFIGLLLGMLVQPIAGVLSDRWRIRIGRIGTIGLAVLAVLASLGLLGVARGLLAISLAYVLIQISASAAQAGQQALLPDRVPSEWRGTASGWKGFMDVGGALVGFAVLGQLLSGGVAPALLAIAGVFVLGFALTVWLLRADDRRRVSPSVEPSSQTRGIRSGTISAQSVDSSSSNQTGFVAGLKSAYTFDVRAHRSFAWLVASRFLFLLGTYAVGRFFLFFVAERLGLEPARASEQAGWLLAALALITVLAAPLAGWAADRFGRVPLMALGAALSMVGAAMLVAASDAVAILLFGGLMALGSAGFSAANWAMAADLAPPDEPARFLALANFGTAGAAAAAGLFGPLADWADLALPGSRYPALFLLAALAFVLSGVVLRNLGAFARPPQQMARAPRR